MKTDLGADLYNCGICGILSVLRFEVCKKCDDAFWLTEMSKKHMNPDDHDIYDIRHIKKCMKQRADLIQELYKKLEE